MRFGGRGFCRQSFGASLRDLLKTSPSTRRKAVLSKPLVSGRVEARRAEIASRTMQFPGYPVKTL